jgi:hypothetical protein
MWWINHHIIFMAQPAMQKLHYRVNVEAITKQQMQQKMFLTNFFEI